MKNVEERGMTVDRASRYTGVSADMLRWYARRGRIACSRPGGGRRIVFLREDLDKFLVENRSEIVETAPGA